MKLFCVLSAVSDNTVHGLDCDVTVKPGSTRRAVFDWAVDQLAQRLGLTRDQLSVTFFSLEPSDLTAPVAEGTPYRSAEDVAAEQLDEAGEPSYARRILDSLKDQ